MEVELEQPTSGACGDGGSHGAGGAPRATAPTAACESEGTIGPHADWSAICHELRTPLNAILGNVELLLEGTGGPLSADARVCLGEVQAAGRRLMREIEWLLLLAQVEAATPETGTTVDLAALIQAALRRTGAGMTGARAGAEEVVFPVRGDPFWLEVLARALVDLCPVGSGSKREEGARLETRFRPLCAGRELRLLWPGSSPAALPPLAWRLIQTIVTLHGASVRVSDGSFAMVWPEPR